MSMSMTRTRSLSPVLIIAIVASSVALVVNALNRAGIIAVGPVTQFAAPLAQLLAVGLVMAVFAATPAVRDGLGSLGAVLCAVSLMVLAGAEFVINLAFPHILPETINQLHSGPSGISFTISSISFLLGTLVFYTALWRVAGSPRFAILLAVVSSVSIALRTAFPAVVLQGGFGGLVGAVALLAFWLIRSRRVQAADALDAD